MKKKKFFIILFIIVAFIGIFSGLLLVKEKQSLQKEAKISEGVAKGVTQVAIMFRTSPKDSQPKTISGISIRLAYDGKDPNFKIVNSSGAHSNLIYPDSNLTKIQGWTFPVNKVSSQKDKLFIDFAGIYTDISGFSSNDFVTLATIYIKDQSFDQNSLNLTFDLEKSKVMTKEENPKNILSTPDNLYYKIIN